MRTKLTTYLYATRIYFSTMSLIDIFGVFSGVIGFIGFLQSNLPAQADQGDSSVRIAVALNMGGLTNADGTTPTIWAYNENMEWIGVSTDTPYISQGNFQDIKSFNKPVSSEGNRTVLATPRMNMAIPSLRSASPAFKQLTSNSPPATTVSASPISLKLGLTVPNEDG